MTPCSSAAPAAPISENGDPRAQYDLIFGRLSCAAEATLVYPAHDYKGDTVSTIGEEKAFNSAAPGKIDQ